MLDTPYSTRYWRHRYKDPEGHSGRGSYGHLATYKASYINGWVERFNIKSMVELGCGDGNQMSFFNVSKYTGLDVSLEAVERSRARTEGPGSRHFFCIDGPTEDVIEYRSECALSLDVIYHLVEEEVFLGYMSQLRSLTDRFIIIYSSDFEGRDQFNNKFVLHRRFTDYMSQEAREFALVGFEANPHKGPDTTWSDFFVYARIA